MYPTTPTNDPSQPNQPPTNSQRPPIQEDSDTFTSFHTQDMYSPQYNQGPQFGAENNQFDPPIPQTTSIDPNLPNSSLTSPIDNEYGHFGANNQYLGFQPRHQNAYDPSDPIYHQTVSTPAHLNYTLDDGREYPMYNQPHQHPPHNPNPTAAPSPNMSGITPMAAPHSFHTTPPISIANPMHHSHQIMYQHQHAPYNPHSALIDEADLDLDALANTNHPHITPLDSDMDQIDNTFTINPTPAPMQPVHSMYQSNSPHFPPHVKHTYPQHPHPNNHNYNHYASHSNTPQPQSNPQTPLHPDYQPLSTNTTNTTNNSNSIPMQSNRDQNSATDPPTHQVRRNYPHHHHHYPRDDRSGGSEERQDQQFRLDIANASPASHVQYPFSPAYRTPSPHSPNLATPPQDTTLNPTNPATSPILSPVLLNSPPSLDTLTPEPHPEIPFPPQSDGDPTQPSSPSHTHSQTNDITIKDHHQHHHQHHHHHHSVAQKNLSSHQGNRTNPQSTISVQPSQHFSEPSHNPSGLAYFHHVVDGLHQYLEKSHPKNKDGKNKLPSDPLTQDGTSRKSPNDEAYFESPFRYLADDSATDIFTLAHFGDLQTVKQRLTPSLHFEEHLLAQYRQKQEEQAKKSQQTAKQRGLEVTAISENERNDEGINIPHWNLRLPYDYLQQLQRQPGHLSDYVKASTLPLSRTATISGIFPNSSSLTFNQDIIVRTSHFGTNLDTNYFISDEDVIAAVIKYISTTPSLLSLATTTTTTTSTQDQQDSPTSDRQSDDQPNNHKLAQALLEPQHRRAIFALIISHQKALLKLDPFTMRAHDQPTFGAISTGPGSYSTKTTSYIPDVLSNFLIGGDLSSYINLFHVNEQRAGTYEQLLSRFDDPYVGISPQQISSSQPFPPHHDSAPDLNHEHQDDIDDVLPNQSDRESFDDRQVLFDSGDSGYFLRLLSHQRRSPPSRLAFLRAGQLLRDFDGSLNRYGSFIYDPLLKPQGVEMLPDARLQGQYHWGPFGSAIDGTSDIHVISDQFCVKQVAVEFSHHNQTKTVLVSPQGLVSEQTNHIQQLNISNIDQDHNNDPQDTIQQPSFPSTTPSSSSTEMGIEFYRPMQVSFFKQFAISSSAITSSLFGQYNHSPNLHQILQPHTLSLLTSLGDSTADNAFFPSNDQQTQALPTSTTDATTTTTTTPPSVVDDIFNSNLQFQVPFKPNIYFAPFQAMQTTFLHALRCNIPVTQPVVEKNSQTETTLTAKPQPRPAKSQLFKHNSQLLELLRKVYEEQTLLPQITSSSNTVGDQKDQVSADWSPQASLTAFYQHTSRQHRQLSTFLSHLQPLQSRFTQYLESIFDDQNGDVQNQLSTPPTAQDNTAPQLHQSDKQTLRNQLIKSIGQNASLLPGKAKSPSTPVKSILKRQPRKANKRVSFQQSFAAGSSPSDQWQQLVRLLNGQNSKRGKSPSLHRLNKRWNQSYCELAQFRGLTSTDLNPLCPEDLNFVSSSCPSFIVPKPVQLPQPRLPTPQSNRPHPFKTAHFYGTSSTGVSRLQPTSINPNPAQLLLSHHHLHLLGPLATLSANSPYPQNSAHTCSNNSNIQNSANAPTTSSSTTNSNSLHALNNSSDFSTPTTTSIDLSSSFLTPPHSPTPNPYHPSTFSLTTNTQAVLLTYYHHPLQYLSLFLPTHLSTSSLDYKRPATTEIINNNAVLSHNTATSLSTAASAADSPSPRLPSNRPSNSSPNNNRQDQQQERLIRNFILLQQQLALLSSPQHSQRWITMQHQQLQLQLHPLYLPPHHPPFPRAFSHLLAVSLPHLEIHRVFAINQHTITDRAQVDKLFYLSPPDPSTHNASINSPPLIPPADERERVDDPTQLDSRDTPDWNGARYLSFTAATNLATIHDFRSLDALSGSHEHRSPKSAFLPVTTVIQTPSDPSRNQLTTHDPPFLAPLQSHPFPDHLSDANELTSDDNQLPFLHNTHLPTPLAFTQLLHQQSILLSRSKRAQYAHHLPDIVPSFTIASNGDTAWLAEHVPNFDDRNQDYLSLFSSIPSSLRTGSTVLHWAVDGGAFRLVHYLALPYSQSNSTTISTSSSKDAHSTHSKDSSQYGPELQNPPIHAGGGGGGGGSGDQAQSQSTQRDDSAQPSTANSQPTTSSTRTTYKPPIYNINQYDNHFQTPLHIAAATKQFSIAQLLISAGADVWRMNPRLGTIPLHNAVLAHSPSLISLILQQADNQHIAHHIYPCPKFHQPKMADLLLRLPLSRGPHSFIPVLPKTPATVRPQHFDLFNSEQTARLANNLSIHNDMAEEEQQQIDSYHSIDDHPQFQPLSTLQLTDSLSPLQDIQFTSLYGRYQWYIDELSNKRLDSLHRLINVLELNNQQSLLVDKYNALLAQTYQTAYNQAQQDTFDEHYASLPSSDIKSPNPRPIRGDNSSHNIRTKSDITSHLSDNSMTKIPPSSPPILPNFPYQSPPKTFLDYAVYPHQVFSYLGFPESTQAAMCAYCCSELGVDHNINGLLHYHTFTPLTSLATSGVSDPVLGEPQTILKTTQLVEMPIVASTRRHDDDEPDCSDHILNSREKQDDSNPGQNTSLLPLNHTYSVAPKIRKALFFSLTNDSQLPTSAQNNDLLQRLLARTDDAPTTSALPVTKSTHIFNGLKANIYKRFISKFTPHASAFATTHSSRLISLTTSKSTDTSPNSKKPQQAEAVTAILSSHRPSILATIPSSNDTRDARKKSKNHPSQPNQHAGFEFVKFTQFQPLFQHLLATTGHSGTLLRSLKNVCFCNCSECKGSLMSCQCPFPSLNQLLVSLGYSKSLPNTQLHSTCTARNNPHHHHSSSEIQAINTVLRFSMISVELLRRYQRFISSNSPLNPSSQHPGAAALNISISAYKRNAQLTRLRVYQTRQEHYNRKIRAEKTAFKSRRRRRQSALQQLFNARKCETSRGGRFDSKRPQSSLIGQRRILLHRMAEEERVALLSRRKAMTDQDDDINSPTHKGESMAVAVYVPIQDIVSSLKSQTTTTKSNINNPNQTDHLLQQLLTLLLTISSQTKTTPLNTLRQALATIRRAQIFRLGVVLRRHMIQSQQLLNRKPMVGFNPTPALYQFSSQDQMTKSMPQHQLPNTARSPLHTPRSILKPHPQSVSTPAHLINLMPATVFNQLLNMPTRTPVSRTLALLSSAHFQPQSTHPRYNEEDDKQHLISLVDILASVPFSQRYRRRQGFAHNTATFHVPSELVTNFEQNGVNRLRHHDLAIPLSKLEPLFHPRSRRSQSKAQMFLRGYEDNEPISRVQSRAHDPSRGPSEELTNITTTSQHDAPTPHYITPSLSLTNIQTTIQSSTPPSSGDRAQTSSPTLFSLLGFQTPRSVCRRCGISIPASPPQGPSYGLTTTTLSRRFLLAFPLVKPYINLAYAFDTQKQQLLLLVFSLVNLCCFCPLRRHINGDINSLVSAQKSRRETTARTETATHLISTTRYTCTCPCHPLFLSPHQVHQLSAALPSQTRNALKPSNSGDNSSTFLDDPNISLSDLALMSKQLHTIAPSLKLPSVTSLTEQYPEIVDRFEGAAVTQSPVSTQHRPSASKHHAASDPPASPPRKQSMLSSSLANNPVNSVYITCSCGHVHIPINFAALQTKPNSVTSHATKPLLYSRTTASPRTDRDKIDSQQRQVEHFFSYNHTPTTPNARITAHDYSIIGLNSSLVSGFQNTNYHKTKGIGIADDFYHSDLFSAFCLQAGWEQVNYEVPSSQQGGNLQLYEHFANKGLNSTRQNHHTSNKLQPSVNPLGPQPDPLKSHPTLTTQEIKSELSQFLPSSTFHSGPQLPTIIDYLSQDVLQHFLTCRIARIDGLPISFYILPKLGCTMAKPSSIPLLDHFNSPLASVIDSAADPSIKVRAKTDQLDDHTFNQLLTLFNIYGKWIAINAPALRSMSDKLPVTTSLALKNPALTVLPISSPPNIIDKQGGCGTEDIFKHTYLISFSPSFAALPATTRKIHRLISRLVSIEHSLSSHAHHYYLNPYLTTTPDVPSNPQFSHDPKLAQTSFSKTMRALANGKMIILTKVQSYSLHLKILYKNQIQQILRLLNNAHNTADASTPAISPVENRTFTISDVLYLLDAFKVQANETAASFNHDLDDESIHHSHNSLNQNELFADPEELQEDLPDSISTASPLYNASYSNGDLVGLPGHVPQSSTAPHPSTPSVPKSILKRPNRSVNSRKLNEVELAPMSHHTIQPSHDNAVENSALVPGGTPLTHRASAPSSDFTHFPQLSTKTLPHSNLTLYFPLRLNSGGSGAHGEKPKQRLRIRSTSLSKWIDPIASIGTQLFHHRSRKSGRQSKATHRIYKLSLHTPKLTQFKTFLSSHLSSVLHRHNVETLSSSRKVLTPASRTAIFALGIAPPSHHVSALGSAYPSPSNIFSTTSDPVLYFQQHSTSLTPSSMLNLDSSDPTRANQPTLDNESIHRLFSLYWSLFQSQRVLKFLATTWLNPSPSVEMIFRRHKTLLHAYNMAVLHDLILQQRQIRGQYDYYTALSLNEINHLAQTHDSIARSHLRSAHNHSSPTPARSNSIYPPHNHQNRFAPGVDPVKGSHNSPQDNGFDPFNILSLQEYDEMMSKQHKQVVNPLFAHNSSHPSTLHATASEQFSEVLQMNVQHLHTVAGTASSQHSPTAQNIGQMNSSLWALTSHVVSDALKQVWDVNSMPVVNKQRYLRSEQDYVTVYVFCCGCIIQPYNPTPTATNNSTTTSTGFSITSKPTTATPPGFNFTPNSKLPHSILINHENNAINKLASYGLAHTPVPASLSSPITINVINAASSDLESSSIVRGETSSSPSSSSSSSSDQSDTLAAFSTTRDPIQTFCLSFKRKKCPHQDSSSSLAPPSMSITCEMLELYEHYVYPFIKAYLAQLQHFYSYIRDPYGQHVPPLTITTAASRAADMSQAASTGLQHQSKDALLTTTTTTTTTTTASSDRPKPSSLTESSSKKAPRVTQLPPRSVSNGGGTGTKKRKELLQKITPGMTESQLVSLTLPEHQPPSSSFQPTHPPTITTLPPNSRPQPLSPTKTKYPAYPFHRVFSRFQCGCNHDCNRNVTPYLGKSKLNKQTQGNIAATKATPDNSTADVSTTLSSKDTTPLNSLTTAEPIAQGTQLDNPLSAQLASTKSVQFTSQSIDITSDFIEDGRNSTTEPSASQLHPPKPTTTATTDSSALSYHCCHPVPIRVPISYANELCLLADPSVLINLVLDYLAPESAQSEISRLTKLD